MKSIASCSSSLTSEFTERWLSLHKDTPESQNINCTACGYQTCRDMARAIFNQFTPDNRSLSESFKISSLLPIHKHPRNQNYYSIIKKFLFNSNGSYLILITD
jgi:hypothetical protein